jgi:hypothetical protein
MATILPIRDPMPLRGVRAEVFRLRDEAISRLREKTRLPRKTAGVNFVDLTADNHSGSISSQ